MTDFRFFPRVLGDVMSTINAVYEFGTYLELTKIHKLKDDNNITKYPLVWLVWEANENTENWETDSMYKVSPRIFICTNTNSDYRSEQRYTENFEAILYPIWELIKQEMYKSNQIDSFSSQNFNKSDHLYWGESIGISKEKNVLFDTLDAIEIKFNELEIFKNC